MKIWFELTGCIGSLMAMMLVGRLFAATPGDVVIDELFYDPIGSDDGWEYIILYNATSEAINLTGWELQTAGTDFIYGPFDLTGIGIPALSTIIIGEEFVPNPDVEVGFSFNFPNGGSASDGVRIVDAGANVIDTVIYDSPNTNELPGDGGLDPYPDAMCAQDVGPGRALERDYLHTDTDDCSVDFYTAYTYWCEDADGDGYYDEACWGDDCDDTNPLVYPGAVEICHDGIDDDCDGLVDGEDPDCPAEFTLDLDVSYDAVLLNLTYTISTSEPVMWANFAVLTYPEIQVIPLWTVPLPVLDPPVSFPLAFPFPSMGWVGIWTGLFTEEGAQAIDLEWIDTEL